MFSEQSHHLVGFSCVSAVPVFMSPPYQLLQQLKSYPNSSQSGYLNSPSCSDARSTPCYLPKPPLTSPHDNRSRPQNLTTRRPFLEPPSSSPIQVTTSNTYNMLGASRVLLSGSRASAMLSVRSFSTTPRRLATTGSLPPRKPMGAFRGGYVFLFILVQLQHALQALGGASL